MPKNFFQEVVMTLMMVFVMVYGMICYNITLNIGEFSNRVFLMAFNELKIMGPIAFILDLAFVGKLAKMITFKRFNPEKDNPVWIVLSISVCSIWIMCPFMSLAATIIFKGGLIQKEFFSIWIKTTVVNYPMAAGLQLALAGPLVRRIFNLIFKN